MKLSMVTSLRIIISVGLLFLASGWQIVMTDEGASQAGVAKGESCVEPTDFMRRYHMDLLNHQRDDTVINGVRTKKHSLVGCISCHVNKDSAGDYIPINAEEQFCQSCHSYTAVKVDCFQCHATVPAD